MSETEDSELLVVQEREQDDSNDARQRRYANVYDAVAGRVSTRTLHGKPSSFSTTSKNRPSAHKLPAVPPEEVLFRRLNAPTRYMEDDFYFAHENLPADEPLPDSDLLKAIHTYTSDLYNNATLDHGESSWRSMDETALIALGFLLEETANEALGETGDMVFVEGEEVTDSEHGVSSRRTSVSTKWGRKRVNAGSVSGVEGSGREDDLIRFRRRNRRKRRRMDTEPIKISDSEDAIT